MRPVASTQLFDATRPLIGVLHAPPLPGSPNYAGDPATVRERVLADAEALVAGGVDGLLLENFGDAPFYPRRIPHYVVAYMTDLARAVRDRFDRPLGVNVLRNDGQSALAVAHAAGASFIRVNVLCGARLTDQGIIQGIAHELLRDRTRLGVTDIRILADVNVKHSAPAGPGRNLEDETSDLCSRGGADALIVSGPATGRPTDVEELGRVRKAAGQTPILVGSGVTAENIAALAAHADGFIVGTALKVDGVVTNPVDRKRVEAVRIALRRLK